MQGMESKGGKYLGSYLRDLRGRSGLTLRAVESISRTLAEPVAPDYLCRAESGQFIPSAEKLITLAQIYEIPSQHFLDQIELAQCMALAPGDEDPEACRKIGLAAADHGDYSRAYAAFKKGLLILRANGNRVGLSEQLARLGTSLAIALKRLGKFRLAQKEIETVLELKGRSDSVSASALNTLADIHYQLDRMELAEGAALAARRAARRARSDRGLAAALMNLGNVRLERERYRAAIALYRRSISLLPAESADHDMGAALVNVGLCHERLGEIEAAEQAYRDAQQVADRLSNPRLKVACLSHTGRFLARCGRIEEARSLLLNARAMGMTHDFRSETFHATFHLWRMALEAGMGGEAGELFKALKRLRLRMDQRSEEVGSFDAYLDEIRSAVRRKGISNVQDLASDPPVPRRPRGRPRKHAS